MIGIEPLEAMRRAAETRYQLPNVSFHDASAQHTGLPDGAAEIVTCAQSLHWMEPQSTLAEVARILRPGGVFAAYDYDLLPTVSWEVEQAFVTFMAWVRALRQAHAVPLGIQEWDKADHLGRLQASRQFRYVKELLLYHTEALYQQSCYQPQSKGRSKTCLLTRSLHLLTLAPKPLAHDMLPLRLEGAAMTHHTTMLLVTLALGLLAASLTAAAPPPGKMPRIGVLWFGDPWNRPQLEAFRHALRERGWVDGQNLRVEFRYAFFRVDQLPVQAAELVRLPVDVIIATSGPATLAAQQATQTIPIVMMAGDPIGQGLVASLPHPGGNVTGVSNMSPKLSAKRLELLKEAVPSIARVAVLWCPENHVNRAQWQEARVAARVLGLTLQSLEVREVSDFAAVFAAAARDRADAFLILDCPLFGSEVIQQELLSGRPAMYGYRRFVHAGGLMAYGPSMTEMLRRAAAYVDKILKGTKPADLPAEQPMTFELVINLWTAKALGLTIPPSLLFQATEVIR